MEVATVQALVIFESMFGNTEAIARAVGEGIAAHASVTVLPVTDAPAEVGPGIDLLVLGGPTHAFGLSRPSTREDAVKQGAAPVTAAGRGLREWLDEVRVAGPIVVATFDTRVPRAHLPGSAARAALRRLRRRHLTAIAGPASFAVGGTSGPLQDGELERARSWGASLATATLASLADSRGAGV
jgi:hypothetical protein